MIRWRLAFTLFQKEITETLRDRKTILMAVGLPILLYPLIAMSLTKLQESRAEAQEAVRSKVAVWGPLSETLKSDLEKTSKLDLISGLGLDASLQAKLLAGSLPPLPTLDEETPIHTNAPTVKPNQVASAGSHPILLAAEALVRGVVELQIDPEGVAPGTHAPVEHRHVRFEHMREN